MKQSLLKMVVEYSIPEPNSGCWIWLRATTKNGYGKIFYKKNSYLMHRVSAFVFNKIESMSTKLFVCHTCDNRICINPDHLFIGTNQDNIRDMILKKRHNHGQTHPRSKLTDADVMGIREKISLGHSIKSVAKLYNISECNISQIKNNKTWLHI